MMELFQMVAECLNIHLLQSGVRAKLADPAFLNRTKYLYDYFFYH